MKRTMTIFRALVLMVALAFVAYSMATDLAAKDWDPKKSNITAMPFYVADASGQDQMNIQMSAAGEATATDVPSVTLPFDGNLVGISVMVETERTAGTLTITPTVNGSATGVVQYIDDDPTQWAYTDWNRGRFPVTTGQHLGCMWGSDASWAAGTTPSVIVHLWYDINDVD